MRILVEPSAHHLLNAGDAAMLQVACERLRSQWQDAAIGVITDSPERLAAACPGVVAVPAAGRRLWLEEPYASATVQNRLPRAVAARLRDGERALRHRMPAVAAATIRARRRLRGAGSEELDAFLDWASGADLVVVSGAGLLADPFAPRAVTVLELLRAAARRGAATAMVGQGVSRFSDPGLLAEARRTLPEVGLIGLREERTGRAVLRRLGVHEERIAITGDDALELARRLGGDGGSGGGLGLALRRARYAGVSELDAERVAAVVREAAARWDADVVPVPISGVAHERDDRIIETALNAQPSEVQGEHPAGAPGSPGAAVEQVRRCRVVVAGSYHAAVFALALGVPAIGLAGSPYYVEKFLGLADQFDGRLPVVRLDRPDAPRRLEVALDETWTAAAGLRQPLVEAAERQIEAGRAAYRALEDVVAFRRAPAPPRASLRRLGASARRRVALALRPERRFNCADQDHPAWDERAVEAARLLARDLDGERARSPLEVADLGCGNQRLRAVLADVLDRPLRYRGYDLHPQAPDVVPLDVQQGVPAGPFDAVFCLGLLEYLGDVGALAEGLRDSAPRAVVSYVVTDGSERLSVAERAARGWRNHLTRAEVERCFTAAGLEPGDSVVTNRGRTVVWLWRAPVTSG